MTMDAPQTPATQPSSEIDPIKLNMLLQEIRDNQNLGMGILGGAVGALVGAALWAVVTVVTGYKIGWLAVGVGFLAGYGVRLAGKGIDRSFAVAGAAMSLLGCAAGNLLAVCAIGAREAKVPLLDLLSSLDLEIVKNLMTATFSPMDLLFYGIAVYEGYKFSVRGITPHEMARLAR